MESREVWEVKSTGPDAGVDERVKGKGYHGCCLVPGS